MCSPKNRCPFLVGKRKKEITGFGRWQKRCIAFHYNRTEYHYSGIVYIYINKYIDTYIHYIHTIIIIIIIYSLIPIHILYIHTYNYYYIYIYTV